MKSSTLNAPDREAGGTRTNDSTTTLLSRGAECKGEFGFDGALELHGRFEGTLSSETGHLTVGEEALLKADITVSEVVIYGKVQGNIEASEKVELRGRAQVYGDIKANRIIIEDGVIFVGQTERLDDSQDDKPDFDDIFTTLGKPRSAGSVKPVRATEPASGAGSVNGVKSSDALSEA
ncbi:MAG: polymer-forming cytoskeletal protein [Verrucomicrobiota bacterium]